MTKEEIKFVIEDTLGESLNITTPLLSVKCIKISKLEDKYPRLSHSRYKFDIENELLICYTCRKYNGEIDPKWELNKHYDEYNGQIYKYLFDENTMEPYTDIYDLGSIIMIEV